MKNLSYLVFWMLTFAFGTSPVCLAQTNEFKYIEPRSNMLGQCILNLNSKGALYTFRVNPILSLKRKDIKDSIVQVGADTASIVSTLQKQLNLSFLQKTKGYELRLHPSKIKIVYLGPQTLTSSKARGKDLVIGVAYAQSLTVTLEQAVKTDVDYEQAAQMAMTALTEALPGLVLVKQVINGAGDINTSTTRKVIGLWKASNKNLVYGVAMANIADIKGGKNVNGWSRAFSGKKPTELTLATSDACSKQASPIYETGPLNKNQDGDPYQLCYKMVAGKPELVVVDAENSDNVVLTIPRQIGLNGPENIWAGNYYIDTQSRRSGQAMQMVFVSIDAYQKDPKTIVINNRDKDGYLATCISYPMYLFASNKTK